MSNMILNVVIPYETNRLNTRGSESMEIIFEYMGKKITIFDNDRDFNFSVDNLVVIGIPRENLYEEAKRRLSGVTTELLQQQRKHLEENISNYSGKENTELKEVLRAIQEILKSRKN